LTFQGGTDNMGYSLTLQLNYLNTTTVFKLSKPTSDSPLRFVDTDNDGVCR
jgi:hypothetical protein